MRKRALAWGCAGFVLAVFPGLPPAVRGADAVAVAPSPPPAKSWTRFLKGRERKSDDLAYDPDEFFKKHISGYEPFYFIAGKQSPNAKFQISFKYRMLNDSGWLAKKVPGLRGLHLAYTQTSLWDLDAPSMPFYDSSYKPELLYFRRGLVGGAPSDRFRLDIQGGLQHESNGKADPDSRSMNIAYLRPTLAFGEDDGLQLSLSPRVRSYLGRYVDNPDIADYRGYADMQAMLGWKRGFQVSTLGTIGKDGSHCSVRVDVSYPMMLVFDRSSTVYLYGQYFSGYGESFLDYRTKTSVIRAGLALYR